MPPGVAEVDGWFDDSPMPWRVLSGTPRPVEVTRASREGLRQVRVYTHAVQRGDGTISHRREDGGPGVSLDTLHDGKNFYAATGVDLSPADARKLAATLLEAADEVDGWAAL